MFWSSAPRALLSEVARANDGNLQITPKCLKAAGSNEPATNGFLANQRNVRSPRRVKLQSPKCPSMNESIYCGICRCSCQRQPPVEVVYDHCRDQAWVLFFVDEI